MAQASRKGGKRHEMPAHHKLEAFIDEYLDAAGIRGQGRTPCFRSTIGKTGILTGLPMRQAYLSPKPTKPHKRRQRRLPESEARSWSCRNPTTG